MNITKDLGHGFADLFACEVVGPLLSLVCEAPGPCERSDVGGFSC